jgi:hypothetical protein
VITLESNRSRGVQSYELNFEGDSEEQGILITLRDADTGDEVAELWVADATDADIILGDLKTAIEEAF